MNGEKEETMNFKKLVAEVIETGETIVLCDGAEFKNFDRLHELLGKDYDNVNDDLMDGITERDGTTWTHSVYRLGEVEKTIRFTFTPKDK